MAGTGTDTGSKSQTVLQVSDVQLLALLADGLGLEVVARRLDISERTVRRRIRDICDRLKVATPVQAIVWAVRAGVI
jgi:DNA-binding NarL/FixJ family response regulator